jgi:AraC family transcriptional regulator, arabinose operon regulatory protein
LPQLHKTASFTHHFKPFYIKNNGDILPIFDKIYKTLELGYSIDNLLFANMCLSSFLTLFIFNEKHYIQAATDKIDFVDNAILFMQEHLVENISLGDLSKQYNYSVSRFSNLFKQKTGYAPIDYFLQMKMQKACQQLDFTTDSIKSIAYEMGFDDPYYFSKRFRTVIGMSPKKYRMMKKNE